MLNAHPRWQEAFFPASTCRKLKEAHAQLQWRNPMKLQSVHLQKSTSECPKSAHAHAQWREAQQL